MASWACSWGQTRIGGSCFKIIQIIPDRNIATVIPYLQEYCEGEFEYEVAPYHHFLKETPSMALLIFDFSTSQMRRYSSLYFLASFSWAFNRSTSSLLFRSHYASLSFQFIFSSRVVEASCALSCLFSSTCCLSATISASLSLMDLPMSDSFSASYCFSLESR
jgi:hypothetical protein